MVDSPIHAYHLHPGVHPNQQRIEAAAPAGPAQHRSMGHGWLCISIEPVRSPCTRAAEAAKCCRAAKCLLRDIFSSPPETDGRRGAPINHPLTARTICTPNSFAIDEKSAASSSLPGQVSERHSIGHDPPKPEDDLTTLVDRLTDRQTD